MAAGMKIIYDAARGKFEENLRGSYEPMAKAATQAIKDVGRATQRAVKANLASGGFPSRWQSSVKLSVKPKTGNSLDAKFHIYSTINFLSVFQNGARIGGKPLLWLPLPDIPQKVGNSPMRPALFVQKFGPLRAARRSAVPILLGQIATSATGRIGKKTSRKFKAAGSSANKVWVPVFIGISGVQLRKRLNYSAILDASPELVQQRYREYIARNSG